MLVTPIKNMTLTFAPPRGSATTMATLGFKNMIANWQVLPLRLVETVAAVAAGVVLTKFVGFSIFIDSSAITPHTFDPLARHTPPVIAAIVAVLVAIAVVSMAINAFIAAGSIRVYLDGQRAALAAMPRPRLAAFRVFRMREWFAAGRASWWRLFRVNLVTLVNVALAVPVAAVIHHPPGERLDVRVAGCISVPILVIGGILAGLWAQKAEVVCVAVPEASVGESLRSGWSALSANFGRHFLTALIILLACFAAAALMGVVIHEAGGKDPSSYLENIATSIGACWLMASFVALTERV